MTKEEWIKVRDEPYIPLGVWFSYYKEMGGDIEDPTEFEKQFNHVTSGIYLVVVRGQLREISYETALRRLLNYYDNIFDYKI